MLIQTGGNDILRFTNLTELRVVIEELVCVARELVDMVVMMSTGDVGQAPAFPWPLDALLSARTRKVRALFLDVASAGGIEYVDLYNPRRR